MSPRGGAVSKPGENSLRWNKTPKRPPPQDPILNSQSEQKFSNERLARRSQIAYEVERSMERKLGPMRNIKEAREEWERHGYYGEAA